MNVLVIVGGAIAIICILIFIVSIFNIGSEKQLTKMANKVIRVQNNIINENEEMLRESANKTADIKKDAVRTIAHSIKEGFSEENTIYCKHCGQAIDGDSKFCKACGKEQ